MNTEEPLLSRFKQKPFSRIKLLKKQGIYT